jgi:hypothetical protein
MSGTGLVIVGAVQVPLVIAEDEHTIHRQALVRVSVEAISHTPGRVSIGLFTNGML